MAAFSPLRSTLRPVASTSRLVQLLASQPGHSTRSFSFWPTSTSSTQSTTPLPPNPAPPLLLHSAPSTILNPTLFEPASNILLAVPPSLGLSYAAFIPIATIVIRLCTTLPITLWQRQRTRRLVEVVMPLVRDGQRKLSFECRDECRRKGMSFEEYQDVFKKRAKSLASSLAWKHSATPLLTLAIPPLIHLPIFITTSLILRDACSRSLEFLSSTLPPSSTHLQHLLDLSATPLLWCESMILPDQSMLLPLAVGVAALLNVETSAKIRKMNVTGVEEVPRDPRMAGDGKGVGMTAADKRRLESAKARRRSFSTTSAVGPAAAATAPASSSNKPKVVNVHLSHSQAQKLVQAGKLIPASTTPTPTPAPAPSPPEIGTSAEEPRTARIISNVLRISAVFFIPIAAMAPSAVCAYWLTSNLFTLAQNLVFAWFDGRRAAAKVRAKEFADIVAR